MNFFRIIFSICQGTGIFPELSRISLLRAFLHLIILSTLLSGLMSIMRYPFIENSITQITQVITDNFGEVRSSDRGIIPSIAPEKPRKVEVMPGLIMEYFPNENVDPKALQVNDYNMGIVWTPGATAIWIKDVMVFPLLYSETILQEHRKVRVEPATPDGISSFIKYYYCADNKFDFSSIRNFTARILYSGLLFSYFIQMGMIFFGCLLFTTMFTGFYALGGGIGLSGVKYKNIWLIGLYAGFPALIVGAVVSGLNLPYVNYSTVYLFGFLGYFFFIVSRMQRDQLKRLEKMEK